MMEVIHRLILKVLKEDHHMDKSICNSCKITRTCDYKFLNEICPCTICLVKGMCSAHCDTYIGFIAKAIKDEDDMRRKYFYKDIPQGEHAYDKP